MRPLIVAISLSAFVLHFVLGCAAHAHAEGGACRLGQAADATMDHAGHSHHGATERHHGGTGPIDQEPSLPEQGSHESGCVFAATVKVEMAKQWCFAATLYLCSVDCVPELVSLSLDRTEGSSAQRYAALRSHLVKSVLLI